MMNLDQKFLLEIARIKEPEIFLGVARVLKVKVLDEETKEPKSFEEILEECIENFKGMVRSRRKELLKILEEANKTPVPKTDKPDTPDTSVNTAREPSNPVNPTSPNQTAPAPSTGGDQNAN